MRASIQYPNGENRRFAPTFLVLDDVLSPPQKIVPPELIGLNVDLDEDMATRPSAKWISPDETSDQHNGNETRSHTNQLNLKIDLVLNSKILPSPRSKHVHLNNLHCRLLSGLQWILEPVAEFRTL